MVSLDTKGAAGWLNEGPPFKVFDIVAHTTHMEFPGVIAAGPNEQGEYLLWWPYRSSGLWYHPNEIKRLPEQPKDWLTLF
jgi:hypothetical protein